MAKKTVDQPFEEGACCPKNPTPQVVFSSSPYGFPAKSNDYRMGKIGS
jgi:hypothetical protein